MATRVGSTSSVSWVASSLSSPINHRTFHLRLLRRVSYGGLCYDPYCFADAKGKSSHFTYGVQGVKKILPIVRCDVSDISSSEEPQTDQLESDAPDELESNIPTFDDSMPSSSSYAARFEGTDGKSGFVSFYNRPYGKESKLITFYPQRNPNNLQWFLGPTVLVNSFILPSVYLRRILSTIFEDSLLTDFLILFFTEALFYCGVAVFLLLIDRMRKSMTFDSTNDYYHRNSPQIGHRVSSVATLVLSLIIPMVTMGFVWPWTGPAASAALTPYLVGIVVQFAFEQYAKYKKSPSLPVIPIIFQVYRLHQLNRAAQLVTALSFTIRGADVTPHSLAINNSLGTLLNVLQFLGVICIWSLSSFVMRYFPSLPLPPSSPQSN